MRGARRRVSTAIAAACVAALGCTTTSDDPSRSRAGSSNQDASAEAAVDAASESDVPSTATVDDAAPCQPLDCSAPGSCPDFDWTAPSAAGFAIQNGVGTELQIGCGYMVLSISGAAAPSFVYVYDEATGKLLGRKSDIGAGVTCEDSRPGTRVDTFLPHCPAAKNCEALGGPTYQCRGDAGNVYALVPPRDL